MSDDIFGRILLTIVICAAAVLCIGLIVNDRLDDMLRDAAAEEIKPEAEQALWWRKAKLKALRDRELESLK